MLSKNWLTIKQMFRFNETPADTAMLYGLYKQGTVGDMPASTKGLWVKFLEEIY